LNLLQENLIRSHAAGVGAAMSAERTKRLLALRINVLAKGYSGISEATLRLLVEYFNKNCLSRVPEQGTLGASGDLAPLAHLALGMLGDGEMWHPVSKTLVPAAQVIEEFGLQRLQLGPKEGLALINGTQQICALGAEALWRAQNLAISADVITALTLEALQGTVAAYFPEIHRARPHAGQSLSAKTMRCLSHSSIYPSENAISHAHCKKVQDAYSLRCAPQVHGVVYDTINFARGILETEMNSATDNPMVFSDTGNIQSGGNFHGEYPAKALDFLTIAVHELANISERRVERLVNSTLSGLPAFLVEEGGLNSGFMIAHCTSAALVSENKTLSHPASVDSIPTSAEKEDHVSMGGWAARKCLQVVANVETVLAIEYLAAAQGLHLRRPLRSNEPIEAIYSLLRDDAKVGPWNCDRYMNPDIEAARKLIEDRRLASLAQPYIARWAELDPTQNYKFVAP
jgi:histidine ammonia-lyase